MSVTIKYKKKKSRKTRVGSKASLKRGPEENRTGARPALFQHGERWWFRDPGACRESEKKTTPWEMEEQTSPHGWMQLATRDRKQKQKQLLTAGPDCVFGDATGLQLWRTKHCEPVGGGVCPVHSNPTLGMRKDWGAWMWEVSTHHQELLQRDTASQAPDVGPGGCKEHPANQGRIRRERRRGNQ